MVKKSLDTILEKYFQKKINILIDGETIKAGQFLLSKNMIVHSNYYYELHIKRNNKIDSIKIPYPFEIEEYPDESLLYLDYRLVTIAKNKPELVSLINETSKTTPHNHKFFNKIVEIIFT